ncbi:MAG TPA: hypothetical protein VML36_09605 [Nitrospiria bacterium]|nr:hypothetical protein [Nitrospiria bacterium]
MNRIAVAIGCATLLLLAAGPRAKAQEAQAPPPTSPPQPAAPAQPGTTQPAAPAQPAAPTQPGTTQPAAPAQPAAPTQPGTPEKPAEPTTPAKESRVGHTSFGFGAGPLLSTESNSSAVFGMNFTWDYYLTNAWSVGPLLQVGFANDYNQVGLSAQVRYTFNLPEYPAFRPHLEGGVGFIYISDGGDETKFLMPLGGGIDVQVVKHLFLTSTFLFNVSNLNDNLFVSWIFGFRVEI